MVAVQSPPEQRVVLRNISWRTYECLLADHEDSSAPRFTYDRGTLEIMSPLPTHEDYTWAAESLVEAVIEDRDLDFRNLRSTTFRREDLQRGFEPDACFYLRNEPLVREKVRLDLQSDPPPDLVIEIDVTHSSDYKLPMYALFGVPEVWRYDGRRMEILLLEGDDYRAAAESGALPGVFADALSALVGESTRARRSAWLRRAREWVRGLEHP